MSEIWPSARNQPNPVPTAPSAIDQPKETSVALATTIYSQPLRGSGEYCKVGQACGSATWQLAFRHTDNRTLCTTVLCCHAHPAWSKDQELLAQTSKEGSTMEASGQTLTEQTPGSSQGVPLTGLTWAWHMTEIYQFIGAPRSECT